MCDYCDMPKTIRLNRQFTDTNIQECFIGGGSDGYAIFFRQPMWKIENENGNNVVKIRLSTDYAYMDINFCPFCGQKIDKELWEKNRKIKNENL